MDNNVFGGWHYVIIFAILIMIKVSYGEKYS